MSDSSEKKRLALAALYRKMPTEELGRRIAQGKLVPAAQAAAEFEMQRRLEPDSPHMEPVCPSEQPSRAKVWQGAIGLLMGTAIAWLVFPGQLASLLTLVALTWCVTAMGKEFPRLGTVLGMVLAALPVAAWPWAWMQGALTMQGGDFKPLGALLAWAVLLFASVLCWSLAGMLLFGSRHRGSWSDFYRRLKKTKEDQVDAITK